MCNEARNLGERVTAAILEVRFTTFLRVFQARRKTVLPRKYCKVLVAILPEPKILCSTHSPTNLKAAGA
jgi:hypothetical protein